MAIACPLQATDENLSPEMRHKLTHDKAARLYGLA
jgi:hypothetical protein